MSELKGRKRRRKMKKHWYIIWIEECCVCGVTYTVRERVYGRKPKDPAKRYFYSQFACNTHFS